MLIVDDVITAGTAIRESIEIIRGQGAEIAGIVIALDRQEQGAGSTLSASQEIHQQYGFPVHSIVGLAELLDYARGRAELAQYREPLRNYRTRYGASA